MRRRSSRSSTAVKAKYRRRRHRGAVQRGRARHRPRGDAGRGRWPSFAASIAILVFLVIAFRKVPHPVRYGVSAIIAMVHDMLVTLGIFSILSLLFGWEADALFLTALLTVISFSVQDTIVVFDRIRENPPKYRGEPFSAIANRSLLETLHRSLATQLNAMFIMVAILLFGGATIKQFIAVMFFGLISGTYSSIFNAVPMLVGWEERNLLGTKKAQTA